MNADADEVGEGLVGVGRDLGGLGRIGAEHGRDIDRRVFNDSRGDLGLPLIIKPPGLLYRAVTSFGDQTARAIVVVCAARLRASGCMSKLSSSPINRAPRPFNSIYSKM